MNNTRTYAVLYSVPVPGLTTRALADATVIVGPLNGQLYTTETDIPNIIEIRQGYPSGTVVVERLRELTDEIRAWADGFGTWYVSVPMTIRVGERRRLASERLTEEINSRQGEQIERVEVRLIGAKDGNCIYAKYGEESA